MINRRPVPANDILGTSRNAALSVPKAQLLANDADPDGDPLTLTGVSASNAQGGTVALNSTSVTSTPASDFIGTDDFTYDVSDGCGGSASAIVSVTVTKGPVLSVASVARETGGIRIVAQGIAGQAYQLQSSPALNPAAWSNVGPPQTTGTTGRLDYLDATNPLPAEKFYLPLFETRDADRHGFEPADEFTAEVWPGS